MDVVLGLRTRSLCGKSRNGEPTRDLWGSGRTFCFTRSRLHCSLMALRRIMRFCRSIRALIDSVMEDSFVRAPRRGKRLATILLLSSTSRIHAQQPYREELKSKVSTLVRHMIVFNYVNQYHDHQAHVILHIHMHLTPVPLPTPAPPPYAQIPRSSPST
jgi:hypothetical protein